MTDTLYCQNVDTPPDSSQQRVFQFFAMNHAVKILLVGALLASWALFFAYHWAWTPFKRQSYILRTAGLVYEPGPVVLIGDSILAALPPNSCAINVAEPGMMAAQLTAEHAATVAKHAPSRVIVMIGINDLNAGKTPADAARSILTFVRAVQERRPKTVVVVLSILPIAEDTPAWTVNNRSIRQTNTLLRETIAAGFVDISGLFGADALYPAMTYDGVHLNAQGVTVLWNVLFEGLAQKSGGPQCARQ